MRHTKLLLALSAIGFTASAYATNGMNMDGYGPVATGMGGASMAYNNGTAAAMNNPATLGLMSQGSQLDLAVGVLGPDVSSGNVSGKQDSDGTSYVMPAVGYVKKNGAYTYGVALFAQGGMGAEYAAGSAVDQSSGAGVPMSAHASFAPLVAGGLTTAVNTDAHKQRSEVGVGRLIFPLAYNASDKLNIGGSFDVVWAGMDILWSMDARNFLGAMSPGAGANPAKAAALGGMVGSQNLRAQASGSLVDTFINNFSTTGPGTAFGGGAANGAFWNFYYGDFQFSDNSDFTQRAKGYGVGGKLGFTYKMNDKLTIGGAYHTKTALSDMKGDAVMNFKVDLTDLAGGSPGASQQTIALPSKVTVHDFEWPATYGLGIAYQANDRVLLAADWKRLNWADVMKQLDMTCRANDGLTGLAAAFSGTELNFKYPQNWDDQDILELGVAFKATDALTLRAGFNYSSNPVPNNYVNFMFPAIVEKHYTVGMGYAFNKDSGVDFSLTFAPKVTVTETLTESNNLGVTPATTISHSQTNWQLMYSKRF